MTMFRAGQAVPENSLRTFQTRISACLRMPLLQLPCRAVALGWRDCLPVAGSGKSGHGKGKRVEKPIVEVIAVGQHNKRQIFQRLRSHRQPLLSQVDFLSVYFRQLTTSMYLVKTLSTFPDHVLTEPE